MRGTTGVVQEDVGQFITARTESSGPALIFEARL